MTGQRFWLKDGRSAIWMIKSDERGKWDKIRSGRWKIAIKRYDIDDCHITYLRSPFADEVKKPKMGRTKKNIKKRLNENGTHLNLFTNHPNPQPRRNSISLQPLLALIPRITNPTRHLPIAIKRNSRHRPGELWVLPQPLLHLAIPVLSEPAEAKVLKVGWKARELMGHTWSTSLMVWR